MKTLKKQCVKNGTIDIYTICRCSCDCKGEIFEFRQGRNALTNYNWGNS
ncbi:hypothetical protein PV797_09445 [Clostridiaceae bacterium M8S5]|nr:hypothetical protein PV797_09445 [Clostridiaceae bacterium M8S5]